MPPCTPSSCRTPRMPSKDQAGRFTLRCRVRGLQHPLHFQPRTSPRQPRFAALALHFMQLQASCCKATARYFASVAGFYPCKLSLAIALLHPGHEGRTAQSSQLLPGSWLQGLRLQGCPVHAAAIPGAESGDAGRLRTAVWVLGRSSVGPTQAPEPPRRAGETTGHRESLRLEKLLAPQHTASCARAGCSALTLPHPSPPWS